MPTGWKRLLATSKISLDSNVLIYAVGRQTDPRARIASEILRLLPKSDAVLALQALAEFANVTTRKLGLAASAASEAIAQLATLAPIVQADRSTIQKALHLSEHHRLQFWDAMLVATINAAGATVLFSEDMQDDQMIDGVRIVNPFS